MTQEQFQAYLNKEVKDSTLNTNNLFYLLEVIKYNINNNAKLETKEVNKIIKGILKSKRYKTNEKENFLLVMEILKNHFVPHIIEKEEEEENIISNNFNNKAFYLGYLTLNLLETYLGFRRITSKDSYIFA